MTPAISERRNPNIQWVPILAAAVLIIGSAGLMLGWYAELLPQVHLDKNLFLHSSKTLTLAAILLAGLSLGLQIYPLPFTVQTVNRVMRLAARSLAIVIILLGIVSLANIVIDMEAVLHLWFPANRLGQAVTDGHSMSFLTAVCAILAGFGLLLLDHPSSSLRYPAEYCALAVAALMCIPIIGFLFNVQVLTSLVPAPAISREAPPAFIILAIGMLFSRPSHPMMAMVLSPAPGGRLLRTVLPATLSLLVALALLAKWGAYQNLYSEEMISPLALLIGGALLLILFWRAALMLNQEYGSRLKGEAELARTNELIRIVSDFTTDAICVKDHKGRYIFANPIALKIIEKELNAVIGHTAGELFTDPEAADIIEVTNRAVLKEGKPCAYEFSLGPRTGRRTYHVTTAPWFGKQGNVLGTVGIATDITDRKRSEDALKAHETRLEKLVEIRTQEVRELIGHLETMREEEKRAIARELHDDMGASLTALNMHLAILFQQIPNEPGIAERIVQIKALLGSVTATKRRIQNGLRPDKLDIFGIKTAITDQAQDFENYTGVTCSVSLPDEDIKYSTEVEISLFRMVQEALNNIAKHARASKVDIILDDDDEYLSLTIRDNGVGMPLEARPYNPTHGLRGMRERAAYLGGSIAIDSKQGCGTRISITLPKMMAASSLNAAVEMPPVEMPQHPA
jgi:PAS domain S-box-containing protein